MEKPSFRIFFPGRGKQESETYTPKLTQRAHDFSNSKRQAFGGKWENHHPLNQHLSLVLGVHIGQRG